MIRNKSLQNQVCKAAIPRRRIKSLKEIRKKKSAKKKSEKKRTIILRIYASNFRIKTRNLKVY